jgi:hypothetical protein
MAASRRVQRGMGGVDDSSQAGALGTGGVDAQSADDKAAAAPVVREPPPANEEQTLLGSWSSSSSSSSITSSVQRREAAAAMRRDAQHLKEDLAALQCIWRLSKQAEELERAATHEEAVVAAEEREARAVTHDCSSSSMCGGLADRGGTCS